MLGKDAETMKLFELLIRRTRSATNRVEHILVLDARIDSKGTVVQILELDLETLFEKSERS